jgi:hypothetical protein
VAEREDPRSEGVDQDPAVIACEARISVAMSYAGGVRMKILHFARRALASFDP